MKSTVGVWQVLQIMMGSKTDKFMSGKGTEQIFRALWLLQAFSKSAVVFFLFFFNIFLLSFLGFHLAGICH